MVREKSLQLILGVVPRLQMQVLRTLVVIYITLFCKRRPFHPEATEMTSFYLPPVGDNASLKSVSGICTTTAPAAEEPLMLKTPGDTGQAIPAPPAIPKDLLRVKLPPAPKGTSAAHLSGSRKKLLHSCQERFLQQQKEGRAERGGEGGCQWLGKLAAPCKRLLLYESLQGAAIRSAKSGKCKQGCAGKSRREQLCLSCA